jgi:ribosomal protein S18 acetylase RimI-like enzyme
MQILAPAHAGIVHLLGAGLVVRADETKGRFVATTETVSGGVIDAGHPLDNPAWHALTSHHTHLADGDGPARRYQPDVSFYWAVDRLDPEAWAALAALGSGVALARPEPVDPPDGWTVGRTIIGHQMVLGRRATPTWDEPAFRVLTAADVPAMLDLVALTKPGPFFPRTIELGRYIGVEEGGRLVAMAGERLRLPGFTEISAVCSHPDVRGRGLAAALTDAVATEIVGRGETPVLHVAEGNDSAIRLYGRLGFERRTDIRFTGLTAPSHAGSAYNPRR